MTKKEICTNNKSIAYYSGFNGLEIKAFEYDIDDFVYFTVNSWYEQSKKSYHRAKIYYTNNDTFFKFRGYKIKLSDCIRM